MFIPLVLSLFKHFNKTKLRVCYTSVSSFNKVTLLNQVHLPDEQQATHCCSKETCLFTKQPSEEMKEQISNPCP